MKLNSILILLFVSCWSCQENKKELPEEFIPLVASHFPAFPKQKLNPLSEAGIALGKKLFYDPVLSKNGQISCASCHLQQYAFGENSSLSSIGISHNQLMRNSPALMNLAWQNTFFWEGGSTNLELQALGPLTHSHEMSKNLDVLVTDLSADENYYSMFEETFGSSDITIRKIAYALAQFEKTLISDNSKYDKVILQKELFTTHEKIGYKLFQQHCESCHSEVLFSDYSYHNNGLDSVFSYPSEDPHWGRYRVTLDSNDIGKYKTPTLRNIAFSAPYMHDGRFSSLEEVINHYSDNITSTGELSPMNFTLEEKNFILQFLYTLSDSSFIYDKKYKIN